MATLGQFRVQFPEFGSNVSDPFILTMMAAASIELSPTVWGPAGVVGGPMTTYDQGQLYLAAHKLAVSPFGQNSKMVVGNKKGYDRTQYGQEFKLLMTGVTSGFRVA